MQTGDVEKSSSASKEVVKVQVNDNVSITSNGGQTRVDQTHRTLKTRHVQLIGIGGSIGTSLFVQIGFVLPRGGPGSLLIAFVFWCTVVFSVNNCLAEMVTWIPVSSPFVRFCDRFVDPAFGFVAGINFFIYLAFLVPSEITALGLVVSFWTDQIPIAAIITIVLVLYLVLNIFAVKFYGESEFWLALGKVLLAIGLMIFTLVVMVGGNAARDVFGFRNWNPDRVPGTPFVEFIKTGTTGRFMGWLSCLIQATFTVCGPEFLAMAAGEAEYPRKVIPRAYKSIGFRLATFFIGGALCVGILLPHNDPALAAASSGNDPQPGAGSSPYVIAMTNLRIQGLPHLVNVLIMLSVFSAGNSYVFCASRTLYGLALERKLPRFLTKCTKSGVPVYCVFVTLLISLLAFLQVSNNSAVVLQWFVQLVTACQVLNYSFICVAYIKFYRAMQIQNIPRETLPYVGWFQPYCAYYALVMTFIMAWMVGYTVFLPGNWDAATFVFSYIVLFIAPVLFVVWKVSQKTRWIKAEEIRFFEQERKNIDEYEASIGDEKKSSLVDRMWASLLG